MAQFVTHRSTSRFDFDKITWHYDAWYQAPRGAMYDGMEKKAIASLLPRDCNGRALLDVGCRTGHWSAYFAGRRFNVTGVDISEAMLCVARTKQIADSRFEVANAENLLFADNQFDVVAAITALEFTAHPKRMLLEIARCVKKPKGTLIVGMLNTLSPSNQAKKARPESVYASADFLPPHGVEELISQFGKVDIRIVGFVPKAEWLLPLSPVVEYLCRFLGSKRGAFIAAKVEL